MGPHGRTSRRKADDGCPLRAACYVRMSTEHQRYSIENQLEALQAYAAERGMEIVRTYRDAGKSGLTIAGRPGLRDLIADISSATADFEVVLVYDVSRWGRFQDVGESTHYEFLCRRAGVGVRYCAEGFENDGSIGSEIQKVVKQTMSAEYSRELSVKVFRGQANLIRHGFRQGGEAGYGLRRILIDGDGVPKGELQRGERKSIQTDRVILSAGPQGEVGVIRWIYESFVAGRMPEREIAAKLNERGVATDLGRAWTRGTVHQVLTNAKYVGDNVWNKGSSKLGGKRVSNPPELWVTARDAFPATVPRELFERAREIVNARARRLSDDEMLDALRSILARKGYLSGLVIDEQEGCPSSSTYASRFGSLVQSYTLIGYDPGRDYAYVEENRRLRERHPDVVAAAVDEIRQGGGRVEPLQAGLLSVNGELAVSLVLCRHFETPAGASRWIVRLDTLLCPDLTIAVRMDAGNREARDYYVFPFADMRSDCLRLSETNEAGLETYRAESLGFLGRIAARTPIREVA